MIGEQNGCNEIVLCWRFVSDKEDTCNWDLCPTPPYRYPFAYRVGQNRQIPLPSQTASRRVSPSSQKVFYGTFVLLLCEATLYTTSCGLGELVGRGTIQIGQRSDSSWSQAKNGTNLL
ncbi:hypothetical protein AVEN_92319-1 [Araneus ventricosus]|uniref:Uncharacterized protein n=1 Tax=Araneus ventricosus TaxID=182803 RepID=A0A4Y2AKP9_ARAVE|nr:hypothetical protein AVEN_92319-1 [Araneus ventricosus]